MNKMTTRYLSRLFFLSVLASLVFIAACENDDTEPEPDPPMETGNSKTFTLISISTQLPGGTIKFSELDDGTTKVEIDLNDTEDGASHPAHIHANSGAEGGDIVVSLTSVDGSTGKSETIVATKDDGTAISYQELIDFDGHVNVHLSENDLATLVAQGDIGPKRIHTKHRKFRPL